jgi:hypothetical protein
MKEGEEYIALRKPKYERSIFLLGVMGKWEFNISPYKVVSLPFEFHSLASCWALSI